MNAEVIKAFTSAARDVLAQELGEPIELQDARLQGGPYRVGDITVVVGLAQDIEGAVLMCLSTATAQQYLSNVLGEQVEELDEIALSGIGELGNMIAGTAGARLADSDMSRSLPLLRSSSTAARSRHSHCRVSSYPFARRSDRSTCSSRREFAQISREAVPADGTALRKTMAHGNATVPSARRATSPSRSRSRSRSSSHGASSSE